MTLADRVGTVVIVMLENRSFDHMLGHLRYDGIMPEVKGLEPELAQYENLYKGGSYLPFRRKRDLRLASDLPHEWDFVETQLAWSGVRESFDMNGFVEAYARFTKRNPVKRADPMGFFGPELVPISSFLARNFCVCDAWHCPLPTSTQPNRTMAFCGSSEIFDTPSGPRLIHTDHILFDWLQKEGIRWRVYHDGLSFFALYPSAWSHMLGDDFRDFEHYFHDMQVEPVEEGPQVILVEPSYEDAPHIGPDHPNDNHPPLAAGWGEDFLRRVYEAATVDPERWRRTVLIYVYDEHGGFYDHVAPPRIPYTTRGTPAHEFRSMGPRVPAVVVSPLVAAGSVSHELFDHTSILQLLAEVFTPDRPFSKEVDERREAGIQNISRVLGESPRTDVPRAPSDPIHVQTALGDAISVRPRNGMQASFELATSQLLVTNPEAMRKKYPDLFQWKAAVDALRREPS